MVKTKGKPIATLVNYAMHPEIIGPDQQILSPDLCGPLYDRIEKNGGGIALFMGSSQGGMVTADNRKKETKIRKPGKSASVSVSCLLMNR